ncbi:MAG TPA: dihydrolipoamide acetyltransferase family protein [Streptosporangiaceae bacterium]|jgi:pyruvate dehydrogenase E2 component (dihydrolipoamide acetyltransferase)
MSELKQFRLPDVGEGLTEADIVKWHVQPGDTVKINQILVEIETAKAVVELPSPFAGVVSELLVDEGTTVDVGVPIVSVTTGEGGPSSAAAVAAAEGLSAAQAVPAADALAATEGVAGTEAPADAAGAAAAGGKGEKRQAVLVGYGVKLGRTTRRARKPSPAGNAPGGRAGAAPPAPPVPTAQPVPAVPAAPATPAAGAGGARTLAKPPVRKLAKDLGVDLSALAGSGPQGSITRDDVHQAASAPAGNGVAGSAAVAGGAVAGSTAGGGLAAVWGGGEREERVPIRGVRKFTAAAVTASAFTAPHVTEWLQVDVTDSMAALGRIKNLPEFAGLRVSPLLLAARALMVAIARHPMINSSWDDAAQEIVVHRYVNLGIAAATERGLVVPNVKDAHALTLPDLARAIGQLAETARAGKATPADLSHGTITITNVGVFGVDAGTPILTPGEAAILALGRVRDAPWVVDGQLAVRKVTTLALSFDHRIVDGDLGSAVLSEVGAMLEDPLRVLAWT